MICLLVNFLKSRRISERFFASARGLPYIPLKQTAFSLPARPRPDVIFKKTFPNKAQAKAVIVFNIRHRTNIAMTFEVGDSIEI
jgi:hypothetical protein